MLLLRDALHDACQNLNRDARSVSWREIWEHTACLSEGLYDWVLMRGLPVHAIDSLSPPLHTNLCQCLFSDILPDQASLYIESSQCQNSCSQILYMGHSSVDVRNDIEE